MARCWRVVLGIRPESLPFHAFAFSQPSPPFTCRQPRLLGRGEAAGGDGGRTIENQFRQEATLALTVLPYIAAALGVAVFALTTSAPAMARAEKQAPVNPRR
jgi:hypothetical protein